VKLPFPKPNQETMIDKIIGLIDYLLKLVSFCERFVPPEVHERHINFFF